MSRREGMLFVGRLSKSTRVRDLEDVFEHYGRLARCEVKYGAEMAYAFVDFEDRRDAEDAIKYENGREISGSGIVVEWAKGNRRGGPVSRGGFDDCYRCHRSGHWARDCPDDRNYGYRRQQTGGRNRSPSPRRKRRSRSRSDSRDRDRRKRKRSVSRSRSRSRSKDRRRRSRSNSGNTKRFNRRRSHSRSRSKSKSRSRSKSKSKSVASKSRSRSRSASPAAVNGGNNSDRSASRSPARRSPARSPARSNTSASE